jgi:hypothetical protein
VKLLQEADNDAMGPKPIEAAVLQVVELSNRVHESAVTRNEERAAARGLDGLERARATKRRELEALDQAVELHELAAGPVRESGSS